MGLHTSNMAVSRQISDGVCEDLSNLVKQLKKAGTSGQESKVSALFAEN